MENNNLPDINLAENQGEESPVNNFTGNLLNPDLLELASRVIDKTIDVTVEYVQEALSGLG